MIHRLLAAIALFLVMAPAVFAVDVDHPDVDAFIKSMVSEHEFDRDDLVRILGQAEVKESILEQIKKPAEKTLTWAEYRPIFMTAERVQAGANFWRENRDSLDNISSSTGVPSEIIVGIIGVETYYGRITGGHRVLDALATLAFY